MSPLIRRAERVVKTHRYVANEKAAGVGHFQASRLLLHESVGGKRRERGEFLFKMLLEVDAEFRAHRGEVEREVAHRPHDGFAADFILVAHDVSLVQRHFAGVHGGLPLRQFLFILPIDIGCL